MRDVEIARDKALHERLRRIELVAIVVLQGISDLHLIDGPRADIDPIEVFVLVVVLIDDDTIALGACNAILAATPQGVHDCIGIEIVGVVVAGHIRRHAHHSYCRHQVA